MTADRMTVDDIDRRIEEIEQELLRNDPTLDTQFALLDPVHRRHDAAVFSLLAASAVFLALGLATMSIAAWLVGAISIVAAFTIDTRYDRELRDASPFGSTALGSRPNSDDTARREGESTS